MTDNVNSPPHYTSGGIECIDAIRAALTDDEFRGYCKGNMIKYIWRERNKGGVESLRKAEWYNKRLIREIGEQPENSCANCVKGQTCVRPFEMFCGWHGMFKKSTDVCDAHKKEERE